MTSRALGVGLQRERTSLAWTRTSLGLLGNSVLVLVRHGREFPGPVALTLAGISLAVALLVLVSNSLRSRIVHRPEEALVTPTWIVAGLGVGITVLCLATTVALLLPR